MTTNDARDAESVAEVWSREEFDLRAPGGTRRVLMSRRVTAYDQRKGVEPVWQDIATFDSYNDAEHVLRLLRKATQTDGTDNG